MCIFFRIYGGNKKILLPLWQISKTTKSMKRYLLTLLAAVLTGVVANAQDSSQKQYSVYGVGFYNLENLFDTQHDEGKNDYQFMPDGSYKWNELKYTHKLHNLATVLSELGTDVLTNVGCAVIGVSEVENAHCLQDLCDQPELKARNFKFCHIEGPDKRGVDCAMLYNPSFFTVRDVKLVPYRYELQEDIEKDRQTRGFLTVSGTLAGEHVAVIVCHLPSRFAGSYYRELGGKQIRVVKDSLLRDDPSCKVFVMGDMNDDPINKSMYEALGAKEDIEVVGEGEMYNPFYNYIAKQKTGTLRYDGKWNLFDQIILTPNAVDKKGKKDLSTLKFWKSQIVRRDYLFQSDGKYKHNPKRTHAGGVWLDGYSDHLPVVVYMVKEKN